MQALLQTPFRGSLDHPMNRRKVHRISRSAFSALAIFIALITASSAAAQTGAGATTITINASAEGHLFPHFWEAMFGSGRATLSLRDSYRQDLRDVKRVTGFEYVRFHAILNDEVGIYDEDAQGRPIYNFSYIDQIYDGLLANGVRPFVELSFMPNKLAAKPVFQAFWYKPDVSPPKDWNRWDDLMTQFAKHLVSRYGIDEVSHWYFEVWNEPNIDFWAGDPKQQTYWDLYDHTARALKAVSPKLRVGGPATAQAAWVDTFIRHCNENNVPVDFASSHVYGNDRSEDVFGTNEDIPRDRMVCRAVGKVHDQIKASAMSNLPLIWSEFNASYKNEPEVTDSAYMAPWLAATIRQCDGLVDMMSYWTFSDVFEEQGVVKTPFYGGFGLIAAGGIRKPSYAAFELLHKLGDERLQADSDSVLVTRKKDGTLEVAVWNLVPPEQIGAPRSFTLHFSGGKLRRASIFRVDREHGDPHPAYEKMGSPQYPTPTQLKQLLRATALPAPEAVDLKDGNLRLTVPAHGLAVIEVR